MIAKSFTSGKSLTIGLILLAALVLTLWITIKGIVNSPTLPSIIAITLFIIPSILFIGVIWFGTRYIIYEEHLTIKIGPWTHSKIDIRRITEIKRTKTILSSPANSLKRLSVRYGIGNSVVISPKREKEFIDAVLSINPDVEVGI